MKKYPTVSRGTVYRNLNLLSDIGEIRKLEMSSGADCFDHICHKHYHARCEKCGRVFDVEMEFITVLEYSGRGIHDLIMQAVRRLAQGAGFSLQ